MNKKEIKKLIEVVDLSKLNKSNSILILRDSTLFGTSKDINMLRKYIPENTLICVMDNDQTIETLSEKEMNKFGWYKRDNF